MVTDRHSAPADSLKRRVISAVFMVPAGLLVVWLGGWPLFVAALLCGLGMWIEVRAVTANQISIRSPGLIVGVFGLLIVMWLVTRTSLPDWLPFPILLILAAGVFGLLKEKAPLWSSLALTLVTAAVCGLVEIRSDMQSGFLLTLIIMLCVWFTDIAAYFAGRGFGGPQLAPKGSPNKTWSGAAGAIICSALIGALIAGLRGGNIANWMIFAALVSVIAQLGDLGESYFKRQFNVKDSGSIIPGHGGLLDRLDSFSAVLIVMGAVILFVPEYLAQFLGIEIR